MSEVVISLPQDFVLLQVVPELDAGGVERTAVDISRAVVEAGGTSLIASAGGRLQMELIEHGAELIKMPVQSKNPLTIAANLGRLYRLIRQPQRWRRILDAVPVFLWYALTERRGA